MSIDPPPQDGTTTAYSEALGAQRAGRLSEAVDRYEAILADHPGHVLSLCCLSLCRVDLGQWDAALRLGLRATEMDAHSAEAWHCLGNIQAGMGELQAAANSFYNLLAIRPLFAEGYNNLGKVLLALDHQQAARHCFRSALACKPDFAEANHNLANVLAISQQQEEAVVWYHRALTCQHRFAEAHCGLANSLAALKRHREAKDHYTAALSLRADFAEAHNNLGSTLQALERADEAESCYRKAIILTPAYAEAYYNLGIALTETGRLDAAFESFEKAIALAPDRVSFYRMLAETRPIEKDSPHFRRLALLADDLASFPEKERMELHFALGKVFADNALHERAFPHLLAGNQLKRRTIAYNEAATLALFDRIRSVFTAERIAAGQKNGISSRLPIFIVGMPRSGTTLVEQILASHPQMFGAGEVQDLKTLVHALPAIDGISTFPEIATVLPAERIAQLGADYIAGLQARAPAARRIVDKMLGNFQRIGLIRMALPEARIIHVLRDPVDTCLACFSKLFASSQPYAYDLAELGRYYRAYESLMAHWRAILSSGVMLEVGYEDVVADMEGQARRILDHCGLDWDDRCLSFHRTERPVRTASAAQVRQPLYRSSVGRWHIYGELARPLLKALDEPVER